MHIKRHRTRNNKFARVDFHKSTMASAEVARKLEVDKQNAQPEIRVLRFDAYGKRITR